MTQVAVVDRIASWGANSVIIVGAVAMSLFPIIGMKAWVFLGFMVGHVLWAFYGFRRRDMSVVTLNLVLAAVDVYAAVIRF